MQKYYIITLCLLNFLMVSATTYKVGSSRTYKTPNELYRANVLQDGDIVEIDFDTYSGTDALAKWSKNNLTIKGVGGQPHMVAAGKNIEGKSIWIISGNNITIDNIKFSGCRVPDRNGAGIRVESLNSTIKNCYFLDNENGILTYNQVDSNLTVESSEFNDNGRVNGGFAHNIYVGRINKLTFKYNYTHHCKVGHNLKSRAKENIITYNRIMDEQSGDSSRLIDLPDGGFTIVMGNILMQGVNAPNGNLIGYCVEGCVNPTKQLYVVNNTLINKRGSGLFFDIRNGTALIQNNIIAGRGTLSSGGATKTFKNNLVEATIATVNLVDEANYNYRLNSNSTAINMGESLTSVNGYSLTPTKSYKHPLQFETRTNSGVIDVGAYEFNSSLSSQQTEPNNEVEVSIYPNPVSDYLLINNSTEINRVAVFDLTGKVLNDTSIIANKLDVSNLSEGIFIFSFYKDDNLLSSKKIVVLRNN